MVYAVSAVLPLELVGLHTLLRGSGDVLLRSLVTVLRHLEEASGEVQIGPSGEPSCAVKNTGLR
jgi:hypothetical protein